MLEHFPSTHSRAPEEFSTGKPASVSQPSAGGNCVPARFGRSPSISPGLALLDFALSGFGEFQGDDHFELQHESHGALLVRIAGVSDSGLLQLESEQPLFQVELSPSDLICAIESGCARLAGRPICDMAARFSAGTRDPEKASAHAARV